MEGGWGHKGWGQGPTAGCRCTSPHQHAGAQQPGSLVCSARNNATAPPAPLAPSSRVAGSPTHPRHTPRVRQDGVPLPDAHGQPQGEAVSQACRQPGQQQEEVTEGVDAHAAVEVPGRGHRGGTRRASGCAATAEGLPLPHATSPWAGWAAARRGGQEEQRIAACAAVLLLWYITP